MVRSIIRSSSVASCSSGTKPASSEANNTPHAPLNLTLAQRHYSARLLHLRDLIAAEEAKFKCIVAEIDEIRSGAWDDKIRVRLASNGGTNPNDVADSQLPAELSSEPQQSATNDIASTDDQGTLKLTPERDDTEVHTVDGAIEQPPIEVPPDAPVDDQIANTVPAAEDAVLETTPADIIEIAAEEIATIETSEASKPAPESAEMDVEESIILPEPEDKANEKSQQREGKRKVTDLDNLDENQRERKRARDESIPTDVDEQAPSRPRSTVNSELASYQQTPPSIPNKRFQAVIGMLHSQISQHRNGNIFHNPIKNSEAPDYHDIIKRPMDLKTIKARVKDGIISNSLEFQRDVYLMFANAMMYNRPSSDIYHMAEEMMAESEVHINAFRQTEGFIRSTRS
ncbi:Bromodomain-containing protein [Butyriboletus roseoflavus]|nr:Bromodomain-containing protein [Butyriboletus roseoflavus]